MYSVQIPTLNKHVSWTAVQNFATYINISFLSYKLLLVFSVSNTVHICEVKKFSKILQ